MTEPTQHRFPGETTTYRAARNALLESERALRRQVEAVAAERRALPEGAPVTTDYVFQEGAADLDDTETIVETPFTALFGPDRQSLVIYSFMYGPDAKAPCPMCTAFLDGLDGNAPHITQHTALAIIAKAPIDKIRAFAQRRGWRNLRLLSSAGTSYNADYYGEGPDGDQWPAVNVFTKGDNGIRHRWNSELFFAGAEEGQHPRHVDMMWPLWNMLDLTPEGRPQNWFPGLAYD